MTTRLYLHPTISTVAEITEREDMSDQEERRVLRENAMRYLRELGVRGG